MNAQERAELRKLERHLAELEAAKKTRDLQQTLEVRREVVEAVNAALEKAACAAERCMGEEYTHESHERLAAAAQAIRAMKEQP